MKKIIFWLLLLKIKILAIFLKDFGHFFRDLPSEAVSNVKKVCGFTYFVEFLTSYRIDVGLSKSEISERLWGQNKFLPYPQFFPIGKSLAHSTRKKSIFTMNIFILGQIDLKFQHLATNFWFYFDFDRQNSKKLEFFWKFLNILDFFM